MDLSSRLSKIVAVANAKPFTLYDFLYIYSNCGNLCYIDYMQGAQSLFHYLTRDSPLDWQLDKYPDIDNPDFKVPRLLDAGYEGSRVAEILTKDGMQGDTDRTKKAIYLIMLDIERVSKVICQ